MLIAVTGASGFIGKHVLTNLLQHHMDIVAITRNPEKLCRFSDKVQILEMDIASPDKKIFERMGHPDVLIHLAWDGLSNYKSLHHYESELPKQYNFLKTMIQAGLNSLLVSGTCFEYGLQSGALSERSTASPVNPYGFAKKSLYDQLEFLRTKHPFKLTWARLFYVYGDGQSPSSLYQQLTAAVSKSEAYFDMSGGEQLRDYLPVNQIAELIVELALNHENTGLVNVCSGKPVSVRRLVEIWIEEEGWDIKLNIGLYPYLDYEPMAFWGDRKYLDFILGKQ